MECIELTVFFSSGDVVRVLVAQTSNHNNRVVISSTVLLQCVQDTGLNNERLAMEY